MLVEIKPEQQKLLETAARSGMGPEEVLDQAFAVIRGQYRDEDWMLAEREAIAAHIAEGFAEAERGELGGRLAQPHKLRRSRRSRVK